MLRESLALYVHWPFCRSKCPYCDFNSVAVGELDHVRWRRAYVRELRESIASFNDRQIVSVFFGGGTPSLMEPTTVAAILDGLALSSDAEITLEANPTSVETARFADFRAAGVNWVSVGIQAFDAEALRFLGRTNSVDEACRALDTARRHFERFSFDLITARPAQTATDWERELRHALGFVQDHLSVYQLTVEPGTPFHDQGVSESGEDAACDIFDITQSVLNQAGLPAYEISNHAKPGAESRHNLVYWEGGDYLGIGPGAHGRLTMDGVTHATSQLSDPNAWLEHVEAHGHGTDESVALRHEERADELVMMGLRLTNGIERARFRAITGRDVADVVNAGRLAVLVNEGFLTLNDERLAATAKGWRLLNTILGELLG